MNTTDEKLREALDTIDTLLVSFGPLESNPLWHVLTALRGPDSRSIEEKVWWTIPIREKAFPKTAKKYKGWWTSDDHPSVAAYWPPTYETHFEIHCVDAQCALGLDGNFASEART